MKNLLIVESPAKAKTISKYLGAGYTVMASFGHIRDLPSKNGSVEPDNDFAMHYQVSPKSTKHVKSIVDAAKNADKILLAPDPDREGEAIAWHVLEVLKQKKALKAGAIVERVVFNAITKASVLEAIKKPRTLDMDLIDAQQARRALDYLVGFTLSPILWKKLPGSRSAGRVQSVALRIICDREEEIEAFKTQEYWDIKIDLNNEEKVQFSATLTELEGKKLEKFTIVNESQAGEIEKSLKNKKYQVVSVTKKQAKRKPKPPFITSSLQQEAARKLGFSAKKTMMMAQKLYEGVEIKGANQGLITYMRTDSISVTPEALTKTREYIESTFGKKYLPDAPNVFKSKVKNAQEAHEAIRPVDLSISPTDAKKYLEEDQFKLYDLVFKRMVASQMADVIFDQVVAEIATIPTYAKARATGSVINFDGFYKVYKEDLDDEKDEDEAKQPLPALKENDNLDLIEINPAQHFTDPPPRYSEASLVKKLEELGIGRPSTYAAIISVLQDRGYVRLDAKRFFPEERGRVVTTFLKEFFMKYVEYSYTASIEDELDTISNGKLAWKKFLENFWGNFYKNIKIVEDKPFMEVLDVLNMKIGGQIFGVNEDGSVKNDCPTCKDSKLEKEGILGLRLGKFGAFIGCSNYPECKHTMQIFDKGDAEGAQNAEKRASFEPRNLGKDPKTGFEVMVKIGPYGPYLELEGSGEEETETVDAKGKTKKKKAKKPKRISLPKTIDPNTIDLQGATGMLALPRDVGVHPETGKKIVASIGPYGPYVSHDGKYASLKEDNVLEVGLNRAVDLLVEAANRPKRGRSNAATKTETVSVKKAVAKKSKK
jgi:DNA topoisomerase-1